VMPDIPNHEWHTDHCVKISKSTLPSHSLIGIIDDQIW
jgi:hypothetical protein